MKKRGILLLIGISALTNAFSQLVIKGEFRPRFEYRTGYKSLIPSSSDAAFLVSQRSRITFNYQTGKFSFGLGIQDFRTWGDEKLYNSVGVYGDDASLDLNEAWIAMNVCKTTTIKIGRQYWIYDDERLLSERNWNQSSIKYDGVLFKFLQNNWQFDAGFSWNSAKDTTSGNEYTPKKIKTENFLYLKKPVTDWLTISAIAMATGYTPNDTTPTIYLKGSYGLNFDIKKGNFKFWASGYYQNGHSRTGKDAGAFLVHAKTSYTFGKFLVGAGFDVLSGNNAKSSNTEYLGKDHIFDSFYGVRHRIHGHMDLFQDIPKSTAGGGLVDIYLNLKYQFHPKANIYMDWHYFQLENNVVDPNNEGPDVAYLSKGLGPEMDLGVSWDIASFLNLQGGYSFMSPTSTMDIIQKFEPNGAKFANWAWVMITAKPVFLDTGAK